MWSACSISRSKEQKALHSPCGVYNSPIEARVRFHCLLLQLGQEYDALAAQISASTELDVTAAPPPPAQQPSTSSVDFAASSSGVTLQMPSAVVLVKAEAEKPNPAGSELQNGREGAASQALQVEEEISLDTIKAADRAASNSAAAIPFQSEDIPSEKELGVINGSKASALERREPAPPRSSAPRSSGMSTATAKPRQSSRRTRNVKLIIDPGPSEGHDVPDERKFSRGDDQGEVLRCSSPGFASEKPDTEAGMQCSCSSDGLERKKSKSSQRLTISQVEQASQVEHAQLKVAGRASDPSATGKRKSAVCAKETQLPQWYTVSTGDGGGEAMESRMAQWLEQEDQRLAGPVASQCILSPVSMRRLLWDAVWTLLLCYELWITPLQLLYLEDLAEVPHWMFAAATFTLAYFWADIVLNFFTGYVDLDKQMLIMSRPLVIKNYLRGWFLFDIIATLPWDDLSTRDPMLSPMRAAKATKMSKALRVFKILKLLRVIKAVRAARNIKFLYDHKPIDDLEAETREERTNIGKTWVNAKWLAAQASARNNYAWVHHQADTFIPACKILATLALSSHFFACAIAAALPELFVCPTVNEGLYSYYRSFAWAFCSLTFGEAAIPLPPTPGVWAVSMAAYFTRTVLFAWGAHRIICKALVWKAQEGKYSMDHKKTMIYLKKHGVSAETQLSVLQIIRSGLQTRQEYLSFQRSLNQVPAEVQRTIWQEIWVAKLMTLGLIREVCAWDDRFVLELAQIAREEMYAPKVCVFKHGDLATAAYHITQGEISILSFLSPAPTPPFVPGSWIGEKCLISSGLRRSGVAFTRTACVLMAVPAQGFSMLLEAYGLRSKFDGFCSTQLWRGLCGRCGLLGDHFADECPDLADEDSTWSWLKVLKAPHLDRLSHGSRTSSMSAKRERLPRDFKMFLRRQSLTNLEPAFLSVGINALAMLHTMPMEELRLLLAQEGVDPLSAEEEEKLSALSISLFLQDAESEFRKSLTDEDGDESYFLFLSHYKVEAGTEAALMRNELEGMLLERDASAVVHIFLDSEDLTSLECLKDKVGKSDNLALLLTPGVLTRPWVLVELATAFQVGVPIHPVQLTKPDCEFTFPDDAFYESILDGSLVGEVGGKVIRDCGFDVAEVCQALKHIFKTISCPYSPHRPATIRRAELRGLLQHCSAKGTNPYVSSTSPRHAEYKTRSRSNSGDDNGGGAMGRVGSTLALGR